MTKPGQKPTLISGSSGKPTMIVTKNKRTCTRCSNKIKGGSKCFTIPKVGSGFSHPKPFCIACFKEVLSQTRKDLEKLEASLGIC